MRNDNKNLFIVLVFVIFISISVFCLLKSDFGTSESDSSFNQSGNYKTSDSSSNSSSKQNNTNKGNSTNKSNNGKKSNSNKQNGGNKGNQNNDQNVNNNVVNNESGNNSSTNNQSNDDSSNDSNGSQSSGIVKIPEVSMPSVRVTGIKLHRSKFYVTAGTNYRLIATVTPNAAANKEIIWTTSNKKVAIVKNGLVSGTGAGTATITATTKDGGYKATATVIVYEQKTFTATFVTNGATSIGATKLSCTTTGTSCSVKLPSITRSGGSVLGWGLKQNQIRSDFKVGDSIVLSGNKKIYAITKKPYTITFDSTGADNATKTKKTCYIYNTFKDCTILVPSYRALGKHDNTWKSTSSGNIILANEYISISKDETYKAAFVHPWKRFNSNPPVYQIDRNIAIQKTHTKGQLRFEYEKGIPTSAVNAHISFVNQLYKDMPYLFSPGKVWIFTEATYKKYSIAYGLTHHYGPFLYVDLKYDTGNKVISPNATVHELAHAWDGRFKFKTGKMIRQKSDIVKFYNSLSAKKRKDLSITEWFAGLFTEYYWHYMGRNPSEPSFAGYKDNYSAAEKKQAVNLISKYIKIAKNDYKE